METIDILVDFLNEYNGGVFISSHDIDFLRKLVRSLYFYMGMAIINFL